VFGWQAEKNAVDGTKLIHGAGRQGTTTMKTAALPCAFGSRQTTI
jgi:hypothetical protein